MSERFEWEDGKISDIIIDGHEYDVVQLTGGDGVPSYKHQPSNGDRDHVHTKRGGMHMDTKSEELVDPEWTRETGIGPLEETKLPYPQKIDRRESEVHVGYLGHGSIGSIGIIDRSSREITVISDGEGSIQLGAFPKSELDDTSNVD